MDLDIEIEIPRGGGFAFDRRTVDRDGRMTITDCTLTTASVCPYIGSEIPDWEKLGLVGDRVYQLYRDPVALKAAVPLFDGQPLLFDHVPVSADQPQQQMIVGTIGDARWSAGKVIGTVTVWDSDAIQGIESNMRRDLSVGYYYVPDMTPGRTPAGEQFDGRMRGPLAINHIALVPQGRVAGAMVADEAVTPCASFVKAIPGYNRLR
jgi:uncharacterized protein